MTANKPPERAAKTRLLSLTDLDQRSRAYNMAISAKAAITSDLGGESELSEIEKILVEQAALSSVVVKDAYTRWLQGEPIPLPELSVMQNAFLRIAGTLGLRRRPKDVTASIESYLKQEDT